MYSGGDGCGGTGREAEVSTLIGVLIRVLGGNVGLISRGSGKLNENCGASDSSNLMSGNCLK